MTPLLRDDMVQPTMGAFEAQRSDPGSRTNDEVRSDLRKADSNWSGYVPDLPGCISTGTTLEETERNIREAIHGHVQALREFGEPVPAATTIAREVEVSSAA